LQKSERKGYIENRTHRVLASEICINMRYGYQKVLFKKSYFDLIHTGGDMKKDRAIFLTGTVTAVEKRTSPADDVAKIMAKLLEILDFANIGPAYQVFAPYQAISQ
jgi:hypothetical protein